jgi:uncharacterized DUF497 family protein
LKLTKPGTIGASQLIPGVVRTGSTEARPARRPALAVASARVAHVVSRLSRSHEWGQRRLLKPGEGVRPWQSVCGVDWHYDNGSPQAAANVQAHGVSFGEAATVFQDPLAKIHADLDHSEAEDRAILIGHSSAGRVLLVSFTDRQD